MKFTKDSLSLEEGLTKEWIITNGIGGFCSSSIIGANTRKYHGLLVAPLTPPARRHVILAKLDECLQIENEKYDLYTNVCREYISQGYKYQTEFEKEYVPIFKYKIGDTEIVKTISMDYGKNTVGILYEIKNGNQNAKLTLAPIMNFRDFHQMSTDKELSLKQQNNQGKVRVIIDENSTIPVYMKVSEGKYIEHYNDYFKNMFYIEEEKRGFYPEENHVVPGVFEIEINANENKNISFVCSLEENIDEVNVKDLIDKEIQRLEDVCKKSELIDMEKNKKTKREELIKNLVIASDNFVVYRPNFRLHTLIAGYPWFLDWGRDSLISFEGLLLVTKRFEIAKEVLLTLSRDIKFGLVPNGYSGYDNRPLYNSADASLLFVEAVQKYYEYTNDFEFIKEHLYDAIEHIIEHYNSGIDIDNNNIYVDEDGLLVAGTESTQNTWMDAKYGDIAFTPRNGKAVELNSLWYNANLIMASFARKTRHLLKAKKYKELAEKCRISFESKFYNKKTKCLFDVLGDGKIRPNQLFALSLTYPIIDPQSKMAESIINVVEKKLLNSYGLKTLAKGEENYVEVYEGGPYQRDSSYHQGITWVWLLGLYYNVLKNIKKKAKNKKEIQNKITNFVEKTIKVFAKEVNECGCVGSISEMYDSCKPQLPKGTFAQGWSVSEILRIILDK